MPCWVQDDAAINRCDGASQQRVSHGESEGPGLVQELFGKAMCPLVEGRQGVDGSCGVLGTHPDVPAGKVGAC